MKVLSRLPISPFRIAFDDMKYEKVYKDALRLANKYGVTKFSNYLLYNFEDEPVDLYYRLKINIDLSEEFGKHIYSFPMRYEDINKKDRSFISETWNKHYIRSVKAILNVSKGVFGGDRSFFERAFGKNKDEYLTILSMPKDLLTYRNYYENIGVTQKWKRLFNNLSKDEKEELMYLISNDVFISSNYKINKIISFYKIQFKKENVNEIKQSVII